MLEETSAPAEGLIYATRSDLRLQLRAPVVGTGGPGCTACCAGAPTLEQGIFEFSCEHRCE